MKQKDWLSSQMYFRDMIAQCTQFESNQAIRICNAQSSIYICLNLTVALRETLIVQQIKSFKLLTKNWILMQQN